MPFIAGIGPLGLASFLFYLFHSQGTIPKWTLALTFVELVLIAFAVYPQFPKWSKRKRLNAFSFYLLLNVATNILLMISFITGIGM